jgi:cytochrome oxidase Cu insertion factor (SCO1/SenC/PrrC family)
MMDLFKRVNSKVFLLLYLVVFASLLGMLVFQQLQVEKDERDIPTELAPLLVSPPAHIPQFLLYSNDRKVLTEQSLLGKWSFIYFSHPNCLPGCEAVFSVLENLQQLSASNSRQYLVINYDSEKTTARLSVAKDLPVYSADKSMLEMLTEAFAFLSLRTDFAEYYQLEQQHSIFLTDPKGRVYARFEPPYTSLQIQAEFIRLRDFYARTE